MTEATPVLLYDDKNPELRIFVIKVMSKNTIRVLPTEIEGAIRQILTPVKADTMQPITEYYPMYRRNVRNAMPSLRFAPAQYLRYAVS